MNAAASRVIALAGAPITFYLAITRLTLNDRGWFFLSVSIVSFAWLCDRALGKIVVRFASEEWPRLRWDRSGGLEGDPSARDTIGALLVAATQWFGIAALALFLIAGVGGVLVLSSRFRGSQTNFIVLWCGFVALTAAYLPLIPFLCVAEGCGDLIALQRMRAWQAVAIVVALCTGIVASGPLTAAWLAASAQLLVAVIWLLTRHRGLLRAPRTLPALLLDSVKGMTRRYHDEQARKAKLWIALWALAAFGVFVAR